MILLTLVKVLLLFTLYTTALIENITQRRRAAWCLKLGTVRLYVLLCLMQWRGNNQDSGLSHPHHEIFCLKTECYVILLTSDSSHHENKRKWSTVRKELLIAQQILLVSTLKECIENSMENMHTDVRVEGVKCASYLYHDSLQIMFLICSAFRFQLSYFNRLLTK